MSTNAPPNQDTSPQKLELPRDSFWEQMFELVASWPRTQTDTKDFAKRTYSNHQVRCITQNLKKPSSLTGEIMALRARNIFADAIHIAIDHQTGTGISEFTHQINLRRFDNEDGRWEAWLYVLKSGKDAILASYPETAAMSLDEGLRLIRDTEPVVDPTIGRVRPGITIRKEHR